MTDIPDRPLRNHPIAIVKNLTMLLVSIIIGIAILTDSETDLTTRLISTGILLLITLAIAVPIVMFWRTTTVQFGTEEMTVRRNFISKTNRSVPYDRVAAVNVTRNVFDRIAGTVTLQFNINSAVNAANADIAFVFKTDLGEQIRSFVYTQTFRSTDRTGTPVPASAKRDAEHPSLVHFSLGQVIEHCYLSQPTWSLFWGIFWLVLTVVSLFYGSAGGLITGLIMWAFQTVVPRFFQFMRFYNFRAYRDGQTIVIQSGFVQTYRTSFDVKKINAVRVRRPYLARLSHRSCLEAEVVGINAAKNDTTPTLCLLMPDTAVAELMKELIPEYVTDQPVVHETKHSERSMLLNSVAIDAILLAVFTYPVWLLTGVTAVEGVDPQWLPWINYTPVLLLALALFYPFWASVRNYRLLKVSFGEDRMTMYRGRMDREWVILPYDRMQMAALTGSIVARHYGVCHLSVSVLSTTGSKNIKSGLFPTELLEQVPATVQARIRDGRYDPRITGI